MAKVVWALLGIVVIVAIITISARQKPKIHVQQEPQLAQPKVTPEQASQSLRFSKFTEDQHKRLPDFSTRKPTGNNLDPRIIRYSDQSVDLNATVNKSRQINQQPTAKADLQLISEILSGYQSIYQENPVGENSEITAQLLGLNPKRVVFIDPTNSSVSTEGELLDRWGNPYFFHSLSSKQMDIQSSGPDGKLWTDDDIKFGSIE